jgi:hypothetical protein
MREECSPPVDKTNSSVLHRISDESAGDVERASPFDHSLLDSHEGAVRRCLNGPGVYFGIRSR